MSERREDRVLQELIEHLESGTAPDGSEAIRDEEEARLLREYRELCGLLPFALEPAEPSTGVRRRLLASLSHPRPVGDGSERAVLPGRRVSMGSYRRMQLLAAVMGVLALGLALFSGWTFRGSQMQEARLVELRRSLAESLERNESLAAADREVAGFRQVLTSSRMRVCPLRPSSGDPVQPVARGVVYFDSEAGNWLLTARDLQPCRNGQAYIVWFIVDGRPVAAGRFHVKRGVPVALASDQMPEGVSAVLLTLEPDPEVSEPKGARVLYGEESREMM